MQPIPKRWMFSSSHTALVSANIQHFRRNESENKSDIPEHRELLCEGANLTVISRSRRCCEAFDCCLMFKWCHHWGITLHYNLMKTWYVFTKSVNFVERKWHNGKLFYKTLASMMPSFCESSHNGRPDLMTSSRFTLAASETTDNNETVACRNEWKLRKWTLVRQVMVCPHIIYHVTGVKNAKIDKIQLNIFYKKQC